MVQYIFTPWRDRGELLLVREQLYASQQQQKEDGDDEALRGAVERVFMWTRRGHCPHLVESTACIIQAMLVDRHLIAQPEPLTQTICGGYASAFTRFVTGVLDSHQERAHKMSMYAVAKIIGLPASFVELRHQATHEAMPSLKVLRAAARRALAWIWDNYWVHLAPLPGRDDGGDGGEVRDPCRDALMGLLAEGVDGARGDALGQMVARWGETELLAGLVGIQESTSDVKLLLGTARLSKEILSRNPAVSRTADDGNAAAPRDIGRVREEIAASRREVEELIKHGPPRASPADDADGAGNGEWSTYKGWTPRPIGIP